MRATGFLVQNKSMKQEILELIGYASSVLILISLLMTSVVKFRVINAVGSLIFTVYAILIRSYPTAVLNACLVAVDLWFLVKVLRERVEYIVRQVSLRDEAVGYFLQTYREDILQYFPNWDAQVALADRVYVIYDEMTLAGLLAGRTGEAGELEILLDYSSPRYRDCSVGKALYPMLRQAGIRRLWISTEVEKHARYLRKMGFVRQDSGFVMEWPEM